MESEMTDHDRQREQPRRPAPDLPVDRRSERGTVLDGQEDRDDMLPASEQEGGSRADERSRGFLERGLSILPPG
jgi:hypothetical protein